MTRTSIFDPWPSGKDIRITPSSMSKLCLRAHAYSSAGIRNRATSCNLIFGTTGHDALEHFVRGDISASQIEEFFADNWQKAQAEHWIDYSKTVSHSSLMGIGKAAVKQFADAWGKLPVKVVLQEKRFTHRIADDVVLSAQPDVVVQFTEDYIDKQTGLTVAYEGDVSIIDFKFSSPGSGAKPGFAVNGKQLSLYQVVLEANHEAAGLPSPKIDSVGFMDIKKYSVTSKSVKEGKMVEMPVLYSRTKAQLNEAISAALKIADAIREGNLPRADGGAFNSPCASTMECEYVNHCQFGFSDGLVLPPEVSVSSLMDSEVCYG